MREKSLVGKVLCQFRRVDVSTWVRGCQARTRSETERSDFPYAFLAKLPDGIKVPGLKLHWPRL